MILPNSVISHDCKIGDYTTIAGSATICGGVTIGESSYIGAGASIIGNVTIGECCLVGIGAVVLEDVPDNTVVVGNPARPIRNTIPVEIGI
jgi:acetyltransferase-like isoleucine patch superfamily enzyme